MRVGCHPRHRHAGGYTRSSHVIPPRTVLPIHDGRIGDARQFQVVALIVSHRSTQRTALLIARQFVRSIPYWNARMVVAVRCGHEKSPSRLGSGVAHGFDFAVGQRVRVYPSSSDERFGVIVEDFGDSAGYAVTVVNTRIAEPSRRWAIELDDGTLIFVDTADLQSLQDEI